MSIRNLLYLALTIVTISFTSCAEQEEGYEYDNWKEINEKYIDSIANVAQKNADGKWAVYATFSIGDSVQAFKGQNKYFIYVHKEISVTEGEPPLYNDSVRVHYTGKILPTSKHPFGQIFDKSINGDELNENTDVPGLFKLGSNLILGFSTALLHMKEGEKWTVYIPSYLGYDENGTAKVPGYSTLIFDLKLAKIYRLGGKENTNWR